MLKVIFTLDYEIHGNGDGCPYELMVEPTRRMLELFEQYGAKLTIMADVAEILKFKEHKEFAGTDDCHYDAVESQLRNAVRRGHDVQLHLHPSYFNACYTDGRWIQDWTEYNFATLPLERMEEIVRIGKTYLERLLKPIKPDYQCVAFRAANWAVQPSPNVVRALVRNGIRIDSSVFKYGRREGIVAFDYSDAFSELVPWRVDEENICLKDEDGQLMEIPIYCERRWIGAFVSPGRIFRALLTRRHRVGVGMGAANVPRAPKRSNSVSMLMGRHAWKADFNQCSAGQLSRALRRAARAHDPFGDRELAFVLIGHSKLFNRANERNLRRFLRDVASHPDKFQFGLLAVS